MLLNSEVSKCLAGNGARARRKTTKQEHTHKAIGQALRMAREDRGLDQSDVAQEMGVSQSTWSRKETGTDTVTMEQVFRFCELVGADPGKLMVHVGLLLRWRLEVH